MHKIIKCVLLKTDAAHKNSQNQFINKKEIPIVHVKKCALLVLWCNFSVLMTNAISLR